ncbi:MAG: L-threonylcarbamoyladenylate synthase [Pseudomonadota bacterium]|nr:L-threonylcarbamoyladenylate synthase [Pseudomonadota bacterium]
MNTNAITALINGDIIAYPTESTWGLGVDATNEEAVYQLNVVKGRPKTKSFIVLVNRIDMVHDWIAWDEMPSEININAGWPGPLTKLVPVSKNCPQWLSLHKKIAIRISAHPEVKDLLAIFNKPLISTSANLSGSPILKNPDEIRAHFGDRVKSIVEGTPGGGCPTAIIDVISGTKIR